MKARTLVIGDIYGAYRALVQVLDRVKITENDTLIFLGDYVDGWSQSKQVIDYLLELELKCKCIFIKGNHDVWCEEWLSSGKTNDVWLFHGGSFTVNSYQNLSSLEKSKHLDFYSRMKNYHVDENNKLFIHAGFSSMHGPSKEVYSSNYNWDRTLWEMALSVDKNIPLNSVRYPKRLKLFNEIFIGHTPTIDFGSFEPMNSVNVWNVDTGAAFQGKLSVIDAESKQFWQSDVVRELYPEEKGRNKI
jgi:serine/threonine protein phosphatase 1